VKNLPLEITGDPTEKFEVSQFKRLPRVETTRIRGGMCLVLTEGPALKAKKVWRNLQTWANEYQLGDWRWLKDFISLKDTIRAKETKEEGAADVKIKPDYYYLSDMVAGRPVFSYPMRPGGFRLRYGKSRLTGHGSWAISPLTMCVLKNYVATGTQLRVEHPGKSTALTVCDYIDGPIVKLKDNSVVRVETEEQANEIKNKISAILFLGDLLISHGDFVEQGFRLIPAGYCEEWWVLELKESAKQKLGSDDPTKIAQALDLPESFVKEVLENPIKTKISIKDAEKISQTFSIPLHPYWTYYLKYISEEQKNKIKNIGTDFPLNQEIKGILESIGCPHFVEDNKIKFTDEVLHALKLNLGNEIKIADKAGFTIGARMGRPEKAKLRKMKGSPHVLFPVGEEGGRLRSFQEALNRGYVTAEWPIFECTNCNKQTIYPICETCNQKTISWRVCPICKKKTRKTKCHTETKASERKRINIKDYWGAALNALKMSNPPALVKGVRGTSNKDHQPEHLAKGLLRSKYKLHVNKDGTIRYDASELPITHFKPKEIRTPIDKLKEMGYEKDIKGELLQNEDQVLEIFPQDVILPSCPESFEDGADNVFFNVTKFIDEELEVLYGLEPYYKLNSPSELVGHIVIGLAPHTSAGIAGRIIGFSKTQAVFAHPYWHGACRRDCDGEEMAILLSLDAFLNFSRQYLPDSRGSRSMDAPLVLTTVLNPEEIDDEVYDMNTVWSYPLEFYKATLDYKWPWEISIEQVKQRIGKCEQYEGLGYTHKVDDMNAGVLFSAYKAMPTMIEKLEGQIELASKIRAVDLSDVAGLVIDKHFIRDIKGNLRKFTQQEFRCTTCNEKYRRPPMSGVCKCGGKLVFTIAEGTIKKYLEPSLKLVKHEGVPEYMRQTMTLLKRRIDSIFGKEKTKQIGLGGFI